MLLQIRQLFFQPLQPILGRRIILFLQRLGFNLQLQDLAVQLVQLFGFAVHLHPQPAGGLVHEVNRLVGQETVGDVAVAQRRRSNQRRVSNPHAVVQLILLFDPAEDRDGVLHRRLRHHHGLEPAGQSCVLFHIFAVFIQRGGTHAMQLTPRKGRLDEVGRIHRAIRFARADKRVHLVDEEDDVALRRRHLVQHGLQTLFEITAIFGPRNQRAHIQSHELLVAQGFRHVAVHDAQRKALGNRGFPHARLADQHRVVLGAARQHLHGAANLLVAADDRVDLATGCRLGQIAGVFVQGLHRLFGGGTVGRAALAHLVNRGVQGLGIHRTGGQGIAGPGVHQRQRG